MDPVQGAVLGVVQGLGEFLPISSSGHLIIVPWLLGWPDHSQTFDVALHMGTLFALLIYFWRAFDRCGKRAGGGRGAGLPGRGGIGTACPVDGGSATDRWWGLTVRG